MKTIVFTYLVLSILAVAAMAAPVINAAHEHHTALITALNVY